jgi:putative phosphoesterase
MELLEGADVILHGGDVDSQPILNQLRQVAPVYAVRGNVDSSALALPPSLIRRFDGVQFEMQHILPVRQSDLEQWADDSMPSRGQTAKRDSFLKGFDPVTRVVVFGHSHEPCLVILGGRLFCNPGSAGKKRFSLPRCCCLLETSPRGIAATIKLLEHYNRELPTDIQLDLHPSRPR